MSDRYEEPTVKVLGTVSDLTQGKPGIYFDFGDATEGSNQVPPPGSPGTVS